MNQDKPIFSYACIPLFASLMLFSTTLLSAPIITITPQAPLLPKAIADGDRGTATYKVTNHTKSIIKDYRFQAAPKAGTSAPKQIGGTGILGRPCSVNITLLPSQSCILTLSITSPTNSTIKICRGSQCFAAADLKVNGTPIAIPGNYTDGVTRRPLLALSNDQGSTWSYPASITTPNVTPSIANRAELIDAACDTSTCVAIGVYVDGSGESHPLIASSTNAGASWSYSNNLGGLIDVSPVSVACNTNTCMISGTQSNMNGERNMFIAIKNNKGGSWTIPSTFSQPSLDPAYAKDGAIYKVYYYNSVWFALGSYRDVYDVVRPFLARSTNEGVTWELNNSVSKPNLSPAFLKEGVLASIACNRRFCTSTGSYIDTSNKERSIYSISTDQGKTWSYISNTSLPKITPAAQISNLGLISCSDTTCIIGGTYRDTNNMIRPLLIVTSDQGKTWSAPTIITTAGASAPSESSYTGVTSSTCKGKLCMAIIKSAAQKPKDTTLPTIPVLIQIATSTDSGKTWTLKKQELITKNVNGSKSYSFNLITNIRCNAETCISFGAKFEQKSQGNKMTPLVGVSRNQGGTWDYPAQIQELKSIKPQPASGGLLGIDAFLSW